MFTVFFSKYRVIRCSGRAQPLSTPASGKALAKPLVCIYIVDGGYFTGPESFYDHTQIFDQHDQTNQSAKIHFRQIILSYLILSYLILSYHILSYLILSVIVLSYFIIFCPFLFYHFLSFLILSYFVLSYLISQLILSYLIIFFLSYLIS